MSFSYDVKNELAHIIPEKKCCMLAEIAGFIRLSGTVKLAGKGRFSIVLKTEDPAIARHFKTLIKNYFDVDAGLGNSISPFDKKTTVYELIIASEMNSEQILRETGILTVREGLNDFYEGINESLIKTKCCRKSYLRGLFLAKGTISDPKKGYHLEVSSDSESIALDIKKLFNSFIDIHAKTIMRKNLYVTYIKNSEQIKDILNILGAHNNLLEYENVRVLKEVKNMANRQSNCDNANMDKSIEAGRKQIKAIKKIGIDSLSEKLREVAILRLENPEASLKELGEISDPVLKKSTVSYRIKAIEKMAENHTR